MKRLLLPLIKAPIKLCRFFFNHLVLLSRRLSGKYPPLARLFCPFFPSFGRELYAVLNGINSHDEADTVWYYLRRNIHRMEKGLMMPAQKDAFALGYVIPTMKALEIYCQYTDNVDHDPEYKWFYSISQRYFESVREVDQVREAGAIFRRLPSPDLGGEAGPGPYRCSEKKYSSVDISQFLTLMNQRKSVRWFENKKVPREIVDHAVEAARRAPSGCNRQPFRFRIFDEPELVRRLTAVPMGMAGFETEPPVLAAVIGEHRAFENERDRHLIYIDGAMAAMCFMLALETQGVASCPVNWPDIPEKDLMFSDLIGLEADQQVVLLLAVGFPAPEGMVAWSERKPIDKFRRYNLQ